MKLLFHNHHFKTALQISDRELCFRPRAPRMGTLRMPAELHNLYLINLQHLLELPPEAHQHFSRLLRRSAFATSHIPFTSTRHALAHSLGPQSDTIESFANIDYYTHDFAVVVGRLERLSDRSKHDMQPEFVDWCGSLVFELVGPFPAVLVLRVFPFGTNALFEEVVVGFQGEFGGGGDIVLNCVEGRISIAGEVLLWEYRALDFEGNIAEWRGRETYVNAPEFFHRVKGDYFFQ